MKPTIQAESSITVSPKNEDELIAFINQKYANVGVQPSTVQLIKLDITEIITRFNCEHNADVSPESILDAMGVSAIEKKFEREVLLSTTT